MKKVVKKKTVAKKKPAVAALRIWKFVIRSGRGWVVDPTDSSLQYSDCIAVVLARSEEDARVTLHEYAMHHGVSDMWLRAAEVLILDDINPGVLAWHS